MDRTTTTNLNINVTANTKALVVIGATVYVAARMGTAKALKKGLKKNQRNGSTFKNVVDQTVDKLLNKVEESTRPEPIPELTNMNCYFPTEEGARKVLMRMFEILEENDHVTVAEFNDLVGITGNFKDAALGWKSLYGSQVRESNQGWVVEVPKPGRTI